MTLKNELIVLSAILAVLWLYYAGLVGHIEHLDNKLVNAGINIWEWINDRK